jgi:hypothetical protein
MIKEPGPIYEVSPSLPLGFQVKGRDTRGTATSMNMMPEKARKKQALQRPGNAPWNET